MHGENKYYIEYDVSEGTTWGEFINFYSPEHLSIHETTRNIRYDSGFECFSNALGSYIVVSEDTIIENKDYNFESVVMPDKPIIIEPIF